MREILLVGAGGFVGSVRLAVTVGLLGGFTTFSTFGAETLGLAREGEVWRAAVNVVAQVVLGLAAVWLGDRLGRGV
jgi:CrcB protein